MKPFNILLPVVAALVVALTWLLVGSASPDAARHERTLDALRTVILYDAALQRDVLRARAGLLRSYDPLVAAIAQLHAATDRLADASYIARGQARANIDRRLSELHAGLLDEEALVESFKSDNALLQNSLTYFNHLSGRLADQRDGPAGKIVALAAAMLRFVNGSDSEPAAEANRLLDDLARLPDVASPGTDVRSLVVHGRLIVAKLPRLDSLVARVQASPIGERARALQDAYLDAHRQAVARASLFRILLYAAALVLVAYVVRLFVRLRASAEELSQRLKFEELIASISTQFINVPRDRIGESASNGLAQLVQYAGFDCGRIILTDERDAHFAGSCSLGHAGVSARGDKYDEMIDLALNWPLDGYLRQGCISVPDVSALPEGPEKAALQVQSIRSWLCVPIRYGGERLGFLALKGVSGPMHLPDGTIARLRTAAETFAYAVARERNETEREELQARLSQSQRLESLGTLAGGIAHEFNNILGAILGYGEMAQSALRKDSAARRHVEQILKAGARAQDVVDQILAFGRRRERERKAIRVLPVVREAIELVRASFPATSVRADLGAPDASMIGDPTELQQVVMNLGSNAAQAMDGRGTLQIELDAFESSGDLNLSHGALPRGRYIRLTVRDSGHGMDQATVERIFEPFFTTKPVGKGTGLGLSTVHGIVTGYGGAMNVRSRPGRGTTFKVYLPLMDGVAPEDEEILQAPVHRGHGETILIVDDDRPLVLLGEEMLAALGYEPVGFDKGAAALAAFQADPKRFDLLLTDELMPEMTGTELAGALHEIRPDLPIVLMTGVDRQLRSDRLRLAGIREVLRKPLLSRAMADSLSRHLQPAEARAVTNATESPGP